MYDGQINWGVSSLMEAAENNDNAERKRRRRRSTAKPADDLAISINQIVSFRIGFMDTSSFFANTEFYDTMMNSIGDVLDTYEFIISLNESRMFDTYEPTGGDLTV